MPTLKAAGIERARGLVAALGSDSDNVFVTLSAKALNPELTVVARSSFPRRWTSFGWQARTG